MINFIKKIVVISLCCLPSLSQAQEIKASLSSQLGTDKFWKNMVKVGDRFIRFETVDQKGSPIYFTQARVELTLYDSLLNEIKKISLSDGQKIYNYEPCRIIKVKDKVYFFYQKVLDKKNIENLTAVEIDPETLQAGTEKIIANISKTDRHFNFLNTSTLGPQPLVISVSPAEKRVSVLMEGHDNTLYASLLDENLTVLSEKILNLPERTYPESTCVDDSGNLYLANIEYPSKTNHISIYNQKWEVHDYSINLTDEAIPKKFSMLLSKNNILHIGGCYSTGKNENIEGVFTGEVDLANNKLAMGKQSAFPDSLLTSFEKDGFANPGKRKHGFTPQFYPLFYELEDGSIDIVAQFYEIAATGNTSLFNKYGCIINIHFTANGIIYSRIPRLRTGPNDAGAHFTAVPYQNNMIIFYNDHPDNLEQDIKLRPISSSDYRNAVVVAAVVEADGSVKRNVIAGSKGDNFLAILEYGYKLSKTKLLLPLQKYFVKGNKDKELRWLTVDIR